MQNELEQALETVFPRLDLLSGQRIRHFYQLLLEEAPLLGLSGITDPREVASKHILDCAFLGRALKEESLQWNRLVDIGSGAGLPGIILGILCPFLEEVVLVDSRNKAICWLKKVARDLGLENVVPIQARAEEMGQGKERESFDLVVTRAFGPLPLVLEYCVPLVRIGGTLIAMRGPAESSIEIREILHLLGARVIKETSYTLPWSMGKRKLLFIHKEQSTPSSYPRPGGKAKKRPLVFHVKQYPNG